MPEDDKRRSPKKSRKEEKSRKDNGKKKKDEEKRKRREKKKQDDDSVVREQKSSTTVTRTETPSIFNVSSLAHNAIATEEFKHRISELQFKINSQLIPKRQILLNQMHQIQSKMNEITRVKEDIIKEIRDQFQNIANRITTQENAKQSVLKADMYQLQSQLEDIQSFVQRVSETLATQSLITSGDQLNHHQHENTPFIDLTSECDYLSARPFKSTINVDVSEFRKQLKEGTQHDKKWEELQHLLAIKSAQIEQLIREREEMRQLKDLEIEQLSKLYISTKEELFHWVKMSGDQASSLITG